MARASASERKSFLSLAAAAQQYAQLRRAYSKVFPEDEVEYDHDGAYAEFFTGLPGLVPGWHPGNPRKPAARPWDEMDASERVVWMIRRGAMPWWPSREERDVRWEQQHGEVRERMRPAALRAKRRAA